MKQYGIKVSKKDAPNGPPDSDYHLVLASKVLTRHEAGVLVHLESALGESGMVLLEKAQGTVDEPIALVTLEAARLRLVSRQVAAGSEYLLLQRHIEPAAGTVLVEVDEDGSYEWMERLRDAMNRAKNKDMRVWARTAQVPSDLVFNVLRAGVWGCYRHLPLTDIADAQLQMEHAYVNTLKYGDLSSLRWFESDLCMAAKMQEDGRNLCRVYYASLNFRDIMLATGKLSPDTLPRSLAGQDSVMGFEFSGRSSEGKRVMGILAVRGLATTVLADKEFMWDVPAEWSLEEAATVPVAYTMAYYALVLHGRMRRGESVLVHAGSGGDGHTAIAIALHVGCTVFTTVGTPEKHSFLKERFPSLLDDNIGNSRDCSFELRCTRGQGVDLVFNSLAGDKLLASVRCLTHGGRFLEIGKMDFGLNIFLKNTTFHGIFLDALMDTDKDSTEKRALVQCVSEGIASGAVQPLPTCVSSDTQLEQAFRFMATSKHIGKVLLCLREEEAPATRTPVCLVSASPRTYMHLAKSYVLIGGLGGFGLDLSQWLVTRGATALVFNSRSGIRSGYQSLCLQRWRDKGVTVIVSTADTTGNLKLDDFRVVARPKIDSTKALDAVTRVLSPELDYFVVFSSESCGRGNPGQSNYGLANSAIERMVEQRQADGLPGLAIQWGAIGEVGLFTEMNSNEALLIGMLPLCIASCTETLGALLVRPHAVVASMVLADKCHTTATSQQGLDHAIANILGIKDPSTVSDSAKLAELGMDSLMGAEIKQTLEYGYDMALRVEEVRGLTFAKLRELDVNTVTTRAKTGAGLTPASAEVGNQLGEQIQFSAIGDLMPKQVIVKMPSH